MKILLAISAFALAASIALDLIYNLITFPLKNETEKDPEKGTVYEDPEVFTTFYQLNKPEILRKVPVADSLIKSGSALFYLIFSLTALIAVYLEYRSMTWVLACLPGLVFAYFIAGLVSILLATLLARGPRTEEDPPASSF